MISQLLVIVVAAYLWPAALIGCVMYKLDHSVPGAHDNLLTIVGALTWPITWEVTVEHCGKLIQLRSVRQQHGEMKKRVPSRHQEMHR